MRIPIFYQLERFIRKYRTRYLKRTKNLKYDFISSMGERCYTSMSLDACRLRKYSSPFDWLSGASFEGRVEILNNKFKDFLNAEDLEIVGTTEDKFHNIPCYNRKTDILFLHDFQANKTIEQSIKAVKIKYDRRIARLLKFLSVEKSNILITYAEIPDSKYKIIDDSILINAVDKLNKAFNANIHLFYIEHDEKMKDGEYFYKKINSNITKATLFNENPAEPDILANLKMINMALGNVKLRKQLVY